MGKKLRGVKSVQDFFTEGDQNAGVDFLQYLNTYGDKSTSKTKLFKIKKLFRQIQKKRNLAKKKKNISNLLTDYSKNFKKFFKK